ncbi:MAG: helical backbone metal receptor [Saprospiraceae bacterium]
MSTDYRLLSVVPSITELLFDLGLQDHLVGRTKFCVHPQPEVRTLPIIGGTKNLKIEKITKLKPNLIITNIEENTKGDIETLSKHSEIWLTNIKTLQDNFDLISKAGQIFDRDRQANEIIEKSKITISTLSRPIKKRALYLIWREPYMTIGADTYIHDMMAVLGYDNIFSHSTRYPVVDLQNIDPRSLDVILLSSEPYPFKDKHIHEIQKLFPHIEVNLVNGELFSWYGSRLTHL